MKKLLALGLAFGLGLAFAGAASAQIKMGVGGPMTGGRRRLRRAVEATAPSRRSPTSTPHGGIIGQKIEL